MSTTDWIFLCTMVSAFIALVSCTVVIAYQFRRLNKCVLQIRRLENELEEMNGRVDVLWRKYMSDARSPVPPDGIMKASEIELMIKLTCAERGATDWIRPLN